MRSFLKAPNQSGKNPAATTTPSARHQVVRHDVSAPPESSSTAKHVHSTTEIKGLEHDFTGIPVHGVPRAALELRPASVSDESSDPHPRLETSKQLDLAKAVFQRDATRASGMHGERGLKPNARPDEVVRGRTAGEFLGDVFRPVGAFFGNLFGGLVGALTGLSISSNTHTGPTWLPHGALDWQVAFSTKGRNGWIVQEVNNDFRGKNAAGAAIGNPFTPHYFEAWAVDAAGNVTPSAGGANDFWTNPDFDATLGTTEGHWSTTSSLFFTTTDPATQGFIANNPNTNAGILLSSLTAPAGLGLGIARLHRYAQGHWDAHTAHTGRAGP